MPFSPGISAGQMLLVEQQMRSSYRMRVGIDLLDFQHRLIRSLSSTRIGGSVQVKTSNEGSTRSLQLDLFDPTDLMGLGDGLRAKTPNRMVRVTRGIYVDALGEWIDIPVFTGPLTKPSRGDDTLSIEAQDKVSFAADPRPAFTVRSGTNMGTAIRQIMANAVGETRFRIAPTSKKLTKTHTISREQTPWQLVWRICRAAGWVAFYDGDGYLVCRPRSTTPVTGFTTGPGGSITSQVMTSYWDGEIFNQVTVIGGLVSKTRISRTVTLDRAHPLSPESMRVGSVPWVKTDVLEDSSISKSSDALELATQRLRELSIQQTTASFEALPFWHLQEYDAFTVETPSGVVTSSVQEMTIPLDSESAQAFGFNARTPVSRRKLRVKPKSARLKRAEAKARAARAKARAARKKKRASKR